MIEGIKRVLAYIEENLDGDINMSRVSQLACMSEYTFQKVFSIMTGVTLGQYIRRRRLSCSLYDLAETNARIIDIAVKYGYDSADAYRRAFKQQFGLTPSVARAHPQPLPTFPRLSISITIQGGLDMKYRIEEKEAFRVVGLKASYDDMEQGQSQISGFWDRAAASGKRDILRRYMDDVLPGFMGLCVSHPSGSGFDYWISVTSDKPLTDEGFEDVTVPATKWLVFDAVGPVPSAIQAMYKQIYENFLPGSAYERTDLPDFELYITPDAPMDENYVTEIWIPVKGATETP